MEWINGAILGLGLVILIWIIIQAKKEIPK